MKRARQLRTISEEQNGAEKDGNTRGTARKTDKMLSNRRAWLALKRALWWCVSSVFQLWYLNPVNIIRRRHAKLYYMKMKDNNTARPRWTDVVANILMSDAKRKAKLLKWVQGMTEPAIIDNFTDCWHDGIVLCSLMEAVSPGSCPQLDQLKPEYSKSNCQLGIKLAQKYLSVQKIFANPEIIATASPETENYILHLVQMIRWRYHRLPTVPKVTITRPESSAKVEVKRNIYEARGPGLKSAVIGKRATFTIFTENNDLLDLNIEIRGPNNEINCEKITKLSHERVYSKEDAQPNQTDKNTTYHYMTDPQGNIVLRQRSLEDDSTNIIPFDYHFTVDGSLMVAYVPRSIGMYVIDIFSSGESIQGSPFEVSVTNWTSSWNKVTQKKLLILNSKSYLDEQDHDGLLNNDESSETHTATTDRPRLLRQYTVTKRRVIKRMTTRNGEEIVITDPNTYPGTSRRSSVDVVDMSEQDSQNWLKKYRSMVELRGRNDNSVTSSMHLTARPFSPDNLSLCSFSRRSSGCQSDSNTSSSTDRHGEMDPSDSNPEHVNPPQQATTNKQGDALKQRLSDIPSFKLVRALTHITQPRHIPTLPRRYSEGHLSKVTFSNVDTEMPRNTSYSSHIASRDKSETNELGLSKINQKVLHANIKWAGNTDGQHEKRNLPSEPLIVEENKEKSIAVDHSVLPSLKLHNQNMTSQKINEALMVKLEGEVLNDKRPPHTFNNPITKQTYRGQNMRNPKDKSDKSTQVSSDEIKSETNWVIHGIRRRRRIACSSEEDKTRKIKEYRLKRARKKNEYLASEQNVIRFQGKELGRHLVNEPHSHIHRWLQNNQLRGKVHTSRQSTGDSGISDGSTLGRQIKTDAHTAVEAPTDDQQVFTANLKQEDVVEVWNQTEDHILENDSSISLYFSDSEIQCGPSVLKQRRKVFASKKSSQRSSINTEHAHMTRIPKSTFNSKLTKPGFGRTNLFTQVKAYSIPTSSIENTGTFINKNSNYLRSDSDLAITNHSVKRKCRLPSRKHSYKHSRYQANPSVNTTAEIRHTQQKSDNENITLEKQNLVICNENLYSDKGKKSPSSSSTDELYDGFGVLAQNRNDLLGEIKAFENLALNADKKNMSFITRNIYNKIGHTDTIGESAVLINPNDKINTHQDTNSIQYSEKKAEGILHSPHQIHVDQLKNKALLSLFKPSEQSISVDMDSVETGDILDKSLNRIHGQTTDDDNRTSAKEFEGCVASGAGLEYGYVGIQNNFQVWVEDPDVGNLMVGVRGPRQHCVAETCTTYTGDNLYEITYSVTLPGMYFISVKWNNKPLHNSPFIVKITSTEDDIDDINHCQNNLH